MSTFHLKLPRAARHQTLPAKKKMETCGVRKRGWIREKMEGASPRSPRANVRRGEFSICELRLPYTEINAPTVINIAPGGPHIWRAATARGRSVAAASGTTATTTY